MKAVDNCIQHFFPPAKKRIRYVQPIKSLEMENDEIIKTQYKLAVDARKNVSEEHHKWMTFFYVANGAILVAISSLYSKTNLNKGLLILSLIGAFICLLWNLSCKGYYYYILNWIEIIKRLEAEVTKNESKFMVYSIFSKVVVDKESKSHLPLMSANISTPKLNLLFSFISFLCWTIYSIYQYLENFRSSSVWIKLLMIILIIILSIGGYFLLPKIIKSRTIESHILVE